MAEHKKKHRHAGTVRKERRRLRLEKLRTEKREYLNRMEDGGNNG